MSEPTAANVAPLAALVPDVVGFTKLTAGGNDFICLDNTGGRFDRLLRSQALPVFVRGLCGRGVSVGADGVVFACRPDCAEGVDIAVRFLEPDGSEAELCGNGTACFTYWIVSKGLAPGPEVEILTAAGTVHGKVADGGRGAVRVCIPAPRDLELDLRLEVKGEPWTLHHLNTGVPHAVAFVDSLESIDVDHWGSAIRHHAHFQPRGANANFVKVLEPGHIALRTFEFGVEAETLACGTGSAAAAILSCLCHDWAPEFSAGDRPVLVDVRGDETLRVWFVSHEKRGIIDVCFETRARALCEGELLPELIGELRDACREAIDSGP